MDVSEEEKAKKLKQLEDSVNKQMQTVDAEVADAEARLKERLAAKRQQREEEEMAKIERETIQKEDERSMTELMTTASLQIGDYGDSVAELMTTASLQIGDYGDSVAELMTTASLQIGDYGDNVARPVERKLQGEPTLGTARPLQQLQSASRNEQDWMSLLTASPLFQQAFFQLKEAPTKASLGVQTCGWTCSPNRNDSMKTCVVEASC